MCHHRRRWLELTPSTIISGCRGAWLWVQVVQGQRVPSGNTVSPSLVVHSLKRRQTIQNSLHSSLSSQNSQYRTFNTADCHWLLNTIFMLTNHKYLFKGRHKLDIIKRTRRRGIFTYLALRFEVFAKYWRAPYLR